VRLLSARAASVSCFLITFVAQSVMFLLAWGEAYLRERRCVKDAISRSCVKPSFLIRAIERPRRSSTLSRIDCAVFWTAFLRKRSHSVSEVGRASEKDFRKQSCSYFLLITLHVKCFVVLSQDRIVFPHL